MTKLWGRQKAFGLFRYYIFKHSEVVRILVDAIAAISLVAISFISEFYLRIFAAAILFFIAILVKTTILAAEKYYGMYFNILKRFKHEVKIIRRSTASAERGASVYDDDAASVPSKTFKRFGIDCEVEAHHPNDEIDFHRDMVLIGGPITSRYARLINDKLKAIGTNSFCFSERDGIHIIDHPGEITNNIQFNKTEIGQNFDYGILYIGPNPIHQNFWLIWLAGLGPYATLGMAQELDHGDSIRGIGSLLSEDGAYCSGLFKYGYIGVLNKQSNLFDRVKQTTHRNSTLSRGRLTFPDPSYESKPSQEGSL